MTNQHADLLEPVGQSLAATAEAFTSTIEAAASVLTASHAARQEALREFYVALDKDAAATAARVQSALDLTLERQAQLIEARAEALQAEDGTTADLDESLASVQAALAAWSGLLEEARDFTAALPGFAADLREAHRIAANVVGVLDVL